MYGGGSASYLGSTGSGITVSGSPLPVTKNNQYTQSLSVYQPAQTTANNYYNSPYNPTVEGTSTYREPTYYYQDGTQAASATAAREAADTAAYYNDIAGQLEGQIGQLDNQQNIGLGNINNSYTRSLNRLDQQKGVARRDYDTGLQNNQRSYLGTRNGVMQNARATQNALQRLLGINGSGNSSAAFEQAPYAVGLQASQNLNGAQQTYATNNQSLDTGWQDTERSYNNSREDLDTQKYQQENSLKSGIAQTRASLLDKIANARVQAKIAGGASYGQAAAARTPFQEQINGLLGQITNYGQQYANPVIRTGDIAYKAPSLNQYSLGQFGIGGSQQAPGAQSDMNPAFLGLLNQDDERQGLL